MIRYMKRLQQLLTNEILGTEAQVDIVGGRSVLNRRHRKQLVLHEREHGV